MPTEQTRATSSGVDCVDRRLLPVILYAAAETGCRPLLSEDFQECFTWKGVTRSRTHFRPPTAGGPAWCHLSPERGTQNGFLPEQKAGLATGTAKGLRDHPAGDPEAHTMRFFPGNSRFNFGAIRGSDCTVRFRVSDTSRGT